MEYSAVTGACQSGSRRYIYLPLQDDKMRESSGQYVLGPTGAADGPVHCGYCGHMPRGREGAGLAAVADGITVVKRIRDCAHAGLPGGTVAPPNWVFVLDKSGCPTRGQRSVGAGPWCGEVLGRDAHGGHPPKRRGTGAAPSRPGAGRWRLWRDAQPPALSPYRRSYCPGIRAVSDAAWYPTWPEDMSDGTPKARAKTLAPVLLPLGGNGYRRLTRRWSAN